MADRESRNDSNRWLHGREHTVTVNDYVTKLVTFNSSKKYQEELQYLIQEMRPWPFENILDVGCGLGTTLEVLHQMKYPYLFGYDVTDDLLIYKNWQTIESDFMTKIHDHLEFNTIFFMHSFAHIENPIEILRDVRQTMVQESAVHVFTPNQKYIDLLPENPDYVPDPTVVKHYTFESLSQTLMKGLELSKVLVKPYGPTIKGEPERLHAIAEL